MSQLSTINCQLSILNGPVRFENDYFIIDAAGQIVATLAADQTRKGKTYAAELGQFLADAINTALSSQQLAVSKNT